ncbi:hypothetical protein VTO42DRAFT_693 [Malbranchea cinnamomea]
MTLSNSPQRPSNRGSAKSTFARPKTIDIGESLGPYDTQSVREKIRKWQNQGGGVVIAPDVGASSEEEQKSEETKRQDVRQSTRRPRTRRRREGTTATRIPHNEERRNILSSSTPKKRVVSDGHWRKNRSPPNSVSTNSSPRKRMESTSTKYDETRALFEKRIERAKEEAAKRASSKLLLDDGIKVYAGPLKASKSPPLHDKRSDSEHGSFKVNGDSNVENKAKSSSPKRHESKRRSSRDSPTRRKGKFESGDIPRSDSPAKHYETEWSTQPSDITDPPLSKRRSQSRRRQKRPVPHKSGIFNQVIDESKKMFSSKPEARPPERVHGSKVEAWLSATPDPFSDEQQPSVNAPPSRRSRSQSDGSDSGHHTQRSGDTSDNSRRRSRKTRRHRRDSPRSGRRESRSQGDEKLARPSKIPSSCEREQFPGSSSGLRRSGARKQPTSTYDTSKMSTLQESVEEALRESNPDRPFSSDGSEVSYLERPPPLTLRRPFPATGMHRLSTIASVDTLATGNESVPSQIDQSPREPSKLGHTAGRDQEDRLIESESRDLLDPSSLPPPTASNLKRRLTRHSDLMSVLSAPGGRTRSIRSARSIRTNRSRLATATLSDLMRELASDEARYMRELRTLVGGVIPVLLTSVLSKSDSAIAAGLFRPSADPKDDDSFTRPIVNMGVCLERLKNLHKRIPLNNPEALLSWAQGAQKVYSDYLKAWRLGFQDVIVNLAPPDADGPASQNADAKSLLDGMSQDENGDVINGDGERVDVAYLLKRPLVRLKYLAKTFKGLNHIQPSPKAEEISASYQSLVTDARRRANEERARLEDESAAAIDATRCRDLQTLGVLENTVVDKTRRVRARDFFDLSLLHSTGQQIDCRAELLLRDNSPDKGPGGDLFISEVDNKGRRLLFPPIERERVSARKGDDRGEIVVMVREYPGEHWGWHELLSFKTDDEEICSEWVEMLGMSPIPPKINRSLSFLNRLKEREKPSSIEQESCLLSSLRTDRAPSPTNVNIPIGEQACIVARSSSRNQGQIEQVSPKPSTALSSTGKCFGRPVTPETGAISPRTPTKAQENRSPRSLNEAMSMAGGESPTTPTTLKRAKAQRKSKRPASPRSPTSPAGKRTPERFFKQDPITSEHTRAVENSIQDPEKNPSSPMDTTKTPEEKRPVAKVVRPTRRSLSPVPSLELPTIPRLRKRDPTATATSSPTRSEASEAHDLSEEEDIFWPVDDEPSKENAPAPPPHRTLTPTSEKSRLSGAHIFTPPTPQFTRHRRTSSPLKHEYEPSTATESLPSETSTVEHHEVSSETETSEDDLEDDDIVAPLPPINARRVSKLSPPESLPTEGDTLCPPNSASQDPCKSVSSQPSKAAEAIASVYSWRENGSWEFLHPHECRIVVTPGLIEAYEMDDTKDESGDSDQQNTEKNPLVALELTPLVPIRRGTALDITIRSPPTQRSRLSASSNIMFRSRSPDDCDKLYGLINHSRINNPTYIALQNSRGPFANQPAPSDRPNTPRSSRLSGWFNWYGLSRRNSYRASAVPPPSVGVSESSVGTMSSAFSALKKFGAGSKMFNIARSTLMSRTGSGGGSLYSTSTRSGSPGFQPIDASKAAAGGIGITNAKIRLYCRESASKWRDMGAARLTIMPVTPRSSPPNTSAGATEFNPDQTSPENNAGSHEGATTSSPAPPLQNPLRAEKRILIRGKKHGEVLLDVCLGESCFERVARTGIAVSVWEQYNEVAKEGGVVGGCFKIYMIQMKTEAETAYTFSLVGKLRY